MNGKESSSQRSSRERSVKEFALTGIIERVEAFERDYIFDPHTGEVIGDRLEIESLEREVLSAGQGARLAGR